ncbi:unnamed protein product [Mytilus coruscus]|uniref:Uncharacterized protein n=1 Tax=Mytilus coruscus TaxID=42192 RepID=A0A6J8DM05_MYTCO|nr:unnamed protein product [Mytilus coruscus]
MDYYRPSNMQSASQSVNTTSIQTKSEITPDRHRGETENSTRGNPLHQVRTLWTENHPVGRSPMPGKGVKVINRRSCQSLLALAIYLGKPLFTKDLVLEHTKRPVFKQDRVRPLGSHLTHEEESLNDLVVKNIKKGSYLGYAEPVNKIVDDISSIKKTFNISQVHLPQASTHGQKDKPPETREVYDDGVYIQYIQYTNNIFTIRYLQGPSPAIIDASD